MAEFHLKILATDKKFYNGICQSVILPALDGEQEILAHHEKTVFAMKEGELRFRKEAGGPWNYVVVGIGFAYVGDNSVTILVDTAERPEDIDRVRAERALERAKDQLHQKQSLQAQRISEASLIRAVLRLKEAGKVDTLE